MTSGQSGPYGDPGEQGRSGPPPSQPYGQQYPGFGPAPAAPTGHGAPTPVERPVTVRAGIGAFVANLILGLVTSVVTFSQMDDLVARELARQSADVEVTEEVVRSGIVFGAVVVLIIVGLQILFLWFAWKGHNWARVVLWVLGGLGIVAGLAGLGMENPLGGFAAAIGVFQLLLTIVGVVLLALKPSNDWYRYRGWQRANGQG